jgi:hypothetical protein
MKKSISHQEKLGKCPACSQEYTTHQMQLLDEHDGRTMFHVTFQHCLTSMFIVMANGQFGIMSLGVPTDLVSSEVQEMFGGESISRDQVLDVHEYLKDYSGSTRDLINSLND